MTTDPRETRSFQEEIAEPAADGYAYVGPGADEPKPERDVIQAGRITNDMAAEIAPHLSPFELAVVATLDAIAASLEEITRQVRFDDLPRHAAPPLPSEAFAKGAGTHAYKHPTDPNLIVIARRDDDADGGWSFAVETA